MEEYRVCRQGQTDEELSVVGKRFRRGTE